MNFRFSLSKPSGESVVLGTVRGNRLTFSAAAFKLGYAAMQARRMVNAGCEYLRAESAAVSVNLECGIVVERM